MSFRSRSQTTNGFCYHIRRVGPARVLLLAGMLVVLGAFPGRAGRYALLAGIDQYDPGYEADRLYSCVNDANGIRNCLLADPSRWQSANITRLLDSSATKTAIRNTLTAHAAVAVSGDVVLYYQSSHGGQNSGTSAYLCSYNADYQDSELAADLALFRSGVTVIVVIDACYSGGMFKGGEGASRAKHEWDFARNVMHHYDALLKDRSVKGASIGWITACDFDELSSSGTCYSLFTGNLVYGLVHDHLDGTRIAIVLVASFIRRRF